MKIIRNYTYDNYVTPIPTNFISPTFFSNIFDYRLSMQIKFSLNRDSDSSKLQSF